MKFITVVGEKKDRFKLSENGGRDFFSVVNGGNGAGDFLVISADMFVSDFFFFFVLFLGWAVGNDGGKIGESHAREMLKLAFVQIVLVILLFKGGPGRVKKKEIFFIVL